jgi:hypothetical protein
MMSVLQKDTIGDSPKNICGGKMSRRYYIDVSRKEVAVVSYFPAWEIRNNSKSEWVNKVMVPALLSVVRRKNKKISDIPITFWVGIRETARFPNGEIFLFQTPAYPGSTIVKAIGEALSGIKDGKVFAGIEWIPGETFPICQIFRNKLIRFYYGVKDVDEYYLPAFKWSGDMPYFSLSEIKKSKVVLKNRNSEILYIRSNNSDNDRGEQLRLFQQAMSQIGCEE